MELVTLLGSACLHSKDPIDWLYQFFAICEGCKAGPRTIGWLIDALAALLGRE